ncbi:MAG: glycosyltransferase [Desulfobulbus sp.]|jgi:GT2 family glycosyltransferase|uniref:glycosyltransferase n=1 Tax=Desulfobulbus sp. TaxID=895 RepID=UPI00284096C8|nr:glycosyltransferase [Desulfobulbus sp.]MDR2548603.1 glycosyltransferase [Desulfobulbus sp.]
MNKNYSQSVAVSVVSHGHGTMVERLVTALSNYPEVRQLIVTRNIPESLMLPQDTRIKLIDNSRPAGFGANHNAAFSHCNQPYFCSLNPDIQLEDNPFPFLLAAIEEANAAISAPLVKNPSGGVEDSMRTFPTIRSLLLKALGVSDGRCRIPDASSAFFPEWVAGMFMLFRSDAFKQLRGFDERFFLYYEDVDICARAWQAGMKVVACPTISIVHDARRDSHRQFRYMRWHLSSMIRYFFKHWGRLPGVPNAS